MIEENFGPDGKKLGVDAEVDWQVVFPEDGKWGVRAGRVRFNSGFLDAVQIHGMKFDYTCGPFGANVSLYRVCNIRQDAFGMQGDIQLMRWVDGLMVEMGPVMTGIDVSQEPR